MSRANMKIASNCGKSEPFMREVVPSVKSSATNPHKGLAFSAVHSVSMSLPFAPFRSLSLPFASLSPPFRLPFASLHSTRENPLSARDRGFALITAGRWRGGATGGIPWEGLDELPSRAAE
ncbi:hypothetical protein ADLECEL_06320 [Adlercreutzia equolifaciens subsp. celatus]|nr:hypothetical protein ADLECEL_06320 [Adlercreutzia equolifaciens subsp. celatus]